MNTVEADTTLILIDLPGPDAHGRSILAQSLPGGRRRT
jgi:hypothetical protein